MVYFKIYFKSIFGDIAVLVLSTVQFVKSLTLLETFSMALPEKNYVALPEDWLVAVTDVVKSRAAIAEGRYKAVNMAGVAMISAIMNALDNQQIPYIFATCECRWRKCQPDAQKRAWLYVAAKGHSPRSESQRYE